MTRLRGALIILVFFAITPARAQWQPTSGPAGGTYDTAGPVDIVTLNGHIFVEGDYGDLFESTDTGRTWTSRSWTSIIDSTASYGVMTVSANDLFIGVNEYVYRSTDIGQTWFRADSGLRPSGAQVCELTSSFGVLFAHLVMGYWCRSSNMGLSWDTSSLSSLFGWGVDGLSTSRTRLFSYGYLQHGNQHGNEAFWSSDTGLTWSLLSIGGKSDFTSVAADGPLILARSASGSSYYSTDDGSNWNSSTGLPGSKLGPLFNGGSFALMGCGNQAPLYRSSDGGSTWQSIANLPSSPYYEGANDLFQIGAKIFACNGRGVFFSLDSGFNWIQCPYLQPYTPHLDVHALTNVGNKIVAGGFVTSDDGITWDSSGIPFQPNVFCFPANSNYLYAGTNGGSGDTVGGIFRSSDTGSSWTRIANGLANVNALAASGGKMFAGTDSGIYVSTNGGTNWSPGFRLVHVNALAVQGSKVFAGTSANGLIISTNNGASWSASGGSLPISNVLSLAVKGGILFAGTNGNGLFLSKDTGATWTDVSKGLPSSSVYALEESDSQFFAGTDGGGIYRSNDSGATWKEVDTGLANLRVTSLAIRNGNLFAGTIGGGVWERPLTQMLVFPQAAVSQSVIDKSISIHPNPLTSSTTITLSSSASGFAEITVVNLLGVEVARVFAGAVDAGERTVTWQKPSGLPAGMYECIVRMNGRAERVGMIVE